MTAAITFLGHAGLDVRFGAARVVCDPWLSPGGAYLGAWHPATPGGAPEAGPLHDTPNLFLSSPHPDRFDVETLAGFPKTVRVIVPTLPTRALVDGLKKLGFENVVELPDGQPLDLGGGVQVQVLTGVEKQRLAATLVMESADGAVVDQNVCVLDQAALGRLAGLRPLLHLMQLGAPGYAETRAQALADVAAAARAVGARHVVVSPGAVGLTDADAPTAAAIAAQVAQAAPELAARLHPAATGDVATLAGDDWRMVSTPLAPAPDSSARQAARAKRLEALRAQAEPFDNKQQRAHLFELFQFEDMVWDMKDVLLQVALTDGAPVWVDFRKRPVRHLAACPDAPTHVLTTESAWMSLVMQGTLSWRDLLLGQLATLRHAETARPSPGLAAHLEYRHDADLFALLRALNPATITLQDEKMEYVCQRFCPHQGRDLEYAMIERGVLTCTAHGWRFDLRKDGRCLWGGDTPLRVKEIRPLKP
ncbi:MAG TPA: Rieske 2Fe-2S domain-containing protein [Polyangia bacterium]|nr:Rieske 2Fe-2S domain-containing protein [Polyangia bacterium]